MRSQGDGHIINIGSIVTGKIVPNTAPYSAAKHGLLGFCRAFAEEVKGYGIKVSTVNPGRVDTPGWNKIPDVDRSVFLKPDDVAEAVVFVATRPKHAVVSEMFIIAVCLA